MLKHPAVAKQQCRRGLRPRRAKCVGHEDIRQRASQPERIAKSLGQMQGISLCRGARARLALRRKPNFRHVGLWSAW